MRHRQVVLRRNEPSRRSTNSSLTVRSVRYGECQKNHAAGIGGHAVDGCREFMASGQEGTSSELICAACGCHRNFHRREVETEVLCPCSSAPSNGRQDFNNKHIFTYVVLVKNCLISFFLCWVFSLRLLGLFLMDLIELVFYCSSFMIGGNKVYSCVFEETRLFYATLLLWFASIQSRILIRVMSHEALYTPSLEIEFLLQSGKKRKPGREGI